MLLSGDIGGTKTLLALYDPDRGPRHPVHSKHYASGDYPYLAAMVRDFLGGVELGERATTATFSIAGPVTKGRVATTNLPWPVLEEETLATELGLRRVILLNDLVATAYGVTAMAAQDLRTLHRGQPEATGPIAVVAPGTGLGEGFLTWDGAKYVAHGSEGGHSDFAPLDDVEIELLRFMQKDRDHVSYEYVCSGIGIPNLYEFLTTTGLPPEPPDVAARLDEAPDRTRAIVETAMSEGARSPRCRETVRLFTSILGAECGNLALKVLPTGGIFLAGGLAPAVLPMLEAGPFLTRLHTKGRLSPVLQQMPVHVVTTTTVALIGAALAGLRELDR